MWSPFADRPPRSLAPAATSAGQQSERFGGTWMPTSGSSSRAWRRARGARRSRPRRPSPAAAATDGGRGRCASSPRRPRSRHRPAPRRSSGGAGRSSAGSAPGCGRTRGGTSASASSAAKRSSGRSPMPTRMPLVNGIAQLARGADRLQAQCRVLRRRPLVGDAGRRAATRASAPARRSPRAAARGPHARAHRGWCAAAGRARAPARRPRRRSRRSPRSRAHPVAPRTPGWWAGSSPVSTSSSLTLRRAAWSSSASDLVGLVQMGLVGREGAVLAVRDAGARQRQREVARERDAPPGDGGRRRAHVRTPRSAAGLL